MSRKNDKLTTRCYQLELRSDENEQGIIEGVPIVFERETLIRDSFGEYKEIIRSDALKNSDLSDVRLFINHDVNKITLARSKKGKGTMSLNVQEDGVHFSANLDLENNHEAKALYSAVKRGDMDGMSFMFRVKDDEWLDLESDCPTRVIRNISIVHEISVVNFPAYQQTSVSARSSEETETSPLAEARKKHSLEMGRRLEIEKIKYLILGELQ